ncbi:MAG: hypothetical protein ACMXYK_01970 [Candidatus Woesearchaeota archaeon]
MGLDHILKENEVLLTRAEVRQHNHGDQHLRLSFRGLGSVYVPHQHTYGTIPLTSEELEIFKQLQEYREIARIDPITKEISYEKNPLQEPLGNYARTFNQYFNVLHTRAKVSDAHIFNEVILRDGNFYLCRELTGEEKARNRKRPGKRIFTKGHFDQQARWNIGYGDDPLQGGTVYTIDTPELKEILQRKKSLDEANYVLQKIRRKASRTEKSRMTRSLNELLQNDFFDIQTTNFDAETKNTLQTLAQEEKKYRGFLKNHNADLFYEHGEYRLYLHKRPNLTWERQVRPEVWKNMTYLMLDIETPKFLENNSEIDQVSCCLVREGQTIEKRVYNKVQTDIKEMKGQRVISGFVSDEDIVASISDWLQEEDVDVVMAFNNSFDLKKLRERGDFESDYNDSPKMDVTLKFFERFYMHDVFCLDLYRIGRSMIRGFPNTKLEMLSRVLFDENGYHKEISYREMYELQLLAEERDVELSDSTKTKIAAYIKNVSQNGESQKSGTHTPTFSQSIVHHHANLEEIITTLDAKSLESLDANLLSQVANEMILSYVCDDTDQMPKIFFSEEVQSCFLHGISLANYLQVNAVKVLTGENALKEFWDRGYYKHLGVHRDDIIPRSLPHIKKEIEKDVAAFKKAITSHINQKHASKKEGLHTNLERRLISIPFAMYNYASKATDKVSTLLSEYHENFHDMNSFEQIFISRQLDGLLGYVYEDIGKFLRRRDDYTDFREAIHGLFANNVSREDTQQVLDILIKEGHFGKDPDIKYVVERIKALKDESVFKQYLTQYPEFVESIKPLFENMTWSDMHNFFWRFFMLKKQEGKISVAHRYDPYNLYDSITNILDKELTRAYIDHDIVHADYPFVYMKPKQAPRFLVHEHLDYTSSTEMFEGSNPCLPLQNTVAAHVSKGKVYTKEHGFYKGAKIKPEPAFTTTPFLSELFEPVLNDVLDGNTDDALAFLDTKIQEFLELVENPIDTKALSDEEKEAHLSYNKTKQIYLGRSKGEHYAFALPGVHEQDGVENNVPFVMLPKGVDLKKKKQVKAFIHSIAEYEPDFGVQFDMYRKKIADFIAGIQVQSKEQDLLLRNIKRKLQPKKQAVLMQGELF